MFLQFESFCFVEIFYENDGLEEFIRLFNNETCSDHQHVLETILTLSSAKTNALVILNERDQTLIEQFQDKLNQRLQIILNSEDDQVGSLFLSLKKFEFGNFWFCLEWS